MKSSRLGARAIIATLALSAAQAAPAQADGEDAGSLYLQCDGEPNNVTSGETAARLLGAVTLLGLFAPPPEAADATKRKRGAEGVAACSALIDGEKREGNAERRLGLILARAIHQIEAKNYDGAMADIAMGRSEAEAAGLMADPYFARTRGRAFDLLESAALLRLDRPAEAREASLRGAAALEYSITGLARTPEYLDLVRTGSENEDRFLHWRSRLIPQTADEQASRLEMLGRFADAARLRDALLDFDIGNTPEQHDSVRFGQAAVAHALAGHMALAAERAAGGRANATKRKADGKPESDAAEFVELMDLYGIIETAAGGDLKTARRLFAARSQWVGASLGSVMEVNRRLRAGAAADELIGGLERDGETLWNEQASAKRAEALAKDSDNRTLFTLTPRRLPASSYESISKMVWRADKSKLVLKTKPEALKSNFELMLYPLWGIDVAMDAYVLHAALIARSRGHEGFVFTPMVTERFAAAAFRTGKRGEPGLPAELFLDADDVIAKLSPIIPDPQTLKARRAKRKT